MNKTQLIEALRAHLADKEDIANEAAPALALMRYSLVELTKPTSTQGNNAEADDLRSRLDGMNTAAGRLHAQLADRDGYIYSLLADLGMIPEVDDEPVDSLTEALELVPSLLDDLQIKVASLYATPDEDGDDKDRFITAVRELLEGESLSLQGLWDTLESKAKYINLLEQGLEHRDDLLLQADTRMLAIREALGIPPTAHGTARELELPAIDLLIKQRQAAQDRLLVGRDEAPAENTLEAIIEQIIAITHTDWQDVEELPKEILQMRDNLDAFLFAQNTAPLAQSAWVSDAIDLAHAVRGNLAPENRVMAKAAEAIILRAPEVSDE